MSLHTTIRPINALTAAARQNLPWVSLSVLIAFPAMGFVQKYSGFGGCLAYLLAVTAICGAAKKTCKWWAPTVRNHFKLFSGLTLAGLMVVFAVIHPIEDSRGPGKSSDRDEGLNIAATRMMTGQTPYYPPNKEAGPLSVLPGSIFLATPFVALGDSSYQNLFWLPMFLGCAVCYFKDKALALGLFILLLALSPAAQYEFISGGDLISNGIFMTIFPLAAIVAWSDPNTPAWKRWTSCLLLGIGLASRANFILLIPLFGAAIWRVAGPRQALATSAFVGMVVCAITLPFYLNDPAGFTPLLARAKLGGADHAIPWASNAVIGATILSSLACASWLVRQRPGRMVVDFFRGCTYVTVTPLLFSILLASWAAGRPNFGILQERFGLMFVFFALFGWGAQWLPTVAVNHRHSNAIGEDRQ